MATDYDQKDIDWLVLKYLVVASMYFMLSSFCTGQSSALTFTPTLYNRKNRSNLIHFNLPFGLNHSTPLNL